MRVIVVGCGRVGAGLAGALAARGDTVTVVDKAARAFDLLPEGAVVVAVVRDDGVLPVSPATLLAAGDEVLAVTTLAGEAGLRAALGGQAGGSHTPAG